MSVFVEVVVDLPKPVLVPLRGSAARWADMRRACVVVEDGETRMSLMGVALHQDGSEGVYQNVPCDGAMLAGLGVSEEDRRAVEVARRAAVEAGRCAEALL
ncbi:hypothetical protein [Actinomyces gaoshouyii]|uniref:hypothetical protein n=1 Tax=Actinomyces gaoshouyii TaxID=1960083 RepID=UPI0009C00199|nr:hypothetical protein [Actinomyces gaoshouyii]ARD42464.1 hypothetical protein B6G06_09050 [Actinomyces gaoshouyii]